KLKTGLFLAIEKLLARFATDRIIVITGQQFCEIHEDFGIGRREQFSVIPLGIDLPEHFAAADKRRVLRREVGAADDDVLVGFIGRLTAIKNIPLLLAAALRYRDYPAADLPNIRFLIIGDGDLRSELEAESDLLGLGPLVTFLG